MSGFRWRRLLPLGAAFLGGAATGLAAGFTVALVTLLGGADPTDTAPFSTALANPRTARWIGLIATFAAAVVSTVIVGRLERSDAMAADPARSRSLLAGFALLGLVPG